MANGKEKEAQHIAENLIRERQKAAETNNLLDRQQENYRLQTDKFKEVWDRIESEKDKAAHYKSRLDLSRLEAHMNSIGVSGNPSSALGALDEVEREIERQIDNNNAT